jgi:hypothetical protein
MNARMSSDMSDCGRAAAEDRRGVHRRLRRIVARSQALQPKLKQRTAGGRCSTQRSFGNNDGSAIGEPLRRWESLERYRGYRRIRFSCSSCDLPTQNTVPVIVAEEDSRTLAWRLSMSSISKTHVAPAFSLQPMAVDTGADMAVQPVAVDMAGAAETVRCTGCGGCGCAVHRGCRGCGGCGRGSCIWFAGGRPRDAS